jgi:hypothetical protein
MDFWSDLSKLIEQPEHVTVRRECGTTGEKTIMHVNGQRISGDGYSAGRAAMPLEGEGGSLSGPNQTQRIPIVVQQMEALNKSTSALHELLSLLENRLSPVVLHAPQTNKADTREPRPQHGVPLADGLMEINAKIDAAAGRIASLLQRVEV